MNPLEQVNGYLRSLESRLRWTALSRGFAVIALAALTATIILVIAINSYAFSAPSLRIARILLFLCLAAALAFGLAVPLTRLNRRRAARIAEARVPEFNERLLTFSEGQAERDPFLELLASDAMEIAHRASPDRVVDRKWIFGSLSAGTVAAIVLLWMILMGPGWFGHGASLLWAGTPRPGMRSAFYEILVEPGSRTVRKRSDQSVTAQLVGFTTAKAQLYAKFASSSKWEPAPMQPHENGFQFLFAGLPESVDYYVEANGIRSKEFRLNAIDLPSVKKLRVTWEYPKWSGLKSVVEDPGGDLRAIEGSVATLAIETDQKLNQGTLILDDGSRIELARGDGNWLTARVPVAKDGMYHIAAVEKGEDIRLSEDYFIEAQKEEPPKVRIARPGSDARVSPIEEVAVMVEASDDFGVNSLELHYSVNGGPEKVVPLGGRGQKEIEGQTLISLEDFHMVPGDVIALYAKAKDARSETSSDMLFLEAQPFEREYMQSQVSGGGGGEGQQGEDDQVTRRQKEIIAATFNQIRDKSRDKHAAAENAKFLSDLQSKLRDQTASLARRVKSRELSGSNAEFQSFTKDMEAAAAAMGEAADKLKAQGWQGAIPPEQKALQHLLRAEATRRQIQVAFGRQGGGGGGGGAGRDLESLFDLELDMEKNQYETGQQSASSDQRAKDVDDALQKLEQLARRQQELAERQKQSKDLPQQRWQQEMLRREAEELRRRMEQLSRGQSSQQQQGQQGQQAQSGQSGQTGQQSGQQSGQQAGQAGSQSAQQPQQNQRLRQAMERLTRGIDDMRRAATEQQPGQQQSAQSAADARRAADRLAEARDALGSMRQQESGQSLDSISQRAQRLADQQKDFVDRLKKTFGNGQDLADPRSSQQGSMRQQAEGLAREKEKMMEDLQGLERDMQNAVRSMAGSQRDASSKLREALGQSQQNETKLRMKYQAQHIRQGYGGYVAPREAPITEGLNRLAEQTRQAQAALGPGSGQNGDDPSKQGVERALNQVERLRQQLARASGQQNGQQGQSRSGQNGQQPGQQSGQQGGQQGQQGNQQGQGQQPGQQAGQQGGQSPSGQSGQQPGQQAGMGGQGGGTWGERGGQRGGQYGGLDRVYRSGDAIPEQGQMGTNPGIERALRDSVRELSQMRQELREQGGGDLEREVQDALRELQKYDPAKIASDPVLQQRIQNSVLPAIEQLELQLRRKLDSRNGGQVRSSAAEQAPQGYADAVAEYFRRLSRGTK